MHCPLSQLSQTVLERGFVLLVDLQASDFKIRIWKLSYVFEKNMFLWSWSSQLWRKIIYRFETCITWFIFELLSVFFLLCASCLKPHEPNKPQNWWLLTALMIKAVRVFVWRLKCNCWYNEDIPVLHPEVTFSDTSLPLCFLVIVSKVAYV